MKTEKIANMDRICWIFSWVGGAASVELESNQDCIEKLNSVQAEEGGH